MSHYYTKYCAEPGEYDADVDSDGDCEECVKDFRDKGDGMKIQLTLNQIEMLRNGLLASDWCGFSKRGTVNAICDQAAAAIELQEKITAAEAGLPSEPDCITEMRWFLEQNNGYTSENETLISVRNRLEAYDALRTLATAQAVRIAEGNSETRRLFEALKNIAAFGEDAGGALRYDKNCFLLLNIANAALQLAAKHD